MRIKTEDCLKSSINVRQQNILQLYDRDNSVDFYEKRYSHGYMETWPSEKKDKIIEIIHSLGIPETGEALDFGCGNGVLTDVIRQALPAAWNIYGTDISAVAIENAKKCYPSCRFFVTGDNIYANKKFDFLFTHHVLEHVFNLNQVFCDIDSYLKTTSLMLHILPCGNRDSFEHNICLLREDGVNPQLENRFFFEDEGHLRRMTTEQLNALCANNGFILIKEYYGNQYFGAINWITQSSYSFIRIFTDISQSLNAKAKSKLNKIRFKLLAFWMLRYPSIFIEGKLRKMNKNLRDYILLLAGSPAYFFSKPIDLYLQNMALREWRTKKLERNGSEMYLFFKRAVS